MQATHTSATLGKQEKKLRRTYTGGTKYQLPPGNSNCYYNYTFLVLLETWKYANMTTELVVRFTSMTCVKLIDMKHCNWESKFQPVPPLALDVYE
jgi:hypothetical protein